MNKKLTFANFFDFHSGPKFQIQIVSNTFEDPTEDQIKAQETLMSMTPFTPVSLTGKIFRRESTRRNKEEFEYKATLPKTLVKREFSSRHPSERTAGKAPTFLEIHLQSLQKLNSVAEGLVYTPDTVFPPEQRHLQLRTKHSLYSALRLRAKVASICRNHLERNDFLEVETPLLFKSTPEGAREFLVPTRSKENGGGMCYALPQSPQQYKQILMASGVARYFQLAKCFRDEDLRADRQPEFTQLDLEMSFATGEDVMSVIEELLNKIWYETLGIDLGGGFQRMTWWYAMKFYGSDKPDLRFPKTKINEITSILPHLVKNKDEHIEVICLHADRRSDKEKIEKFRSSFEETHKGKGDDHFLSYVVGHPSAHLHPDLVAAKIDEEKIVEINREIWAPPGSIVIIKLRKGDLSGGSTKLGLLRTSLLAGAQLENLIKTPERPEFVWIIDFPLFSPSSDSEPGQSGTAGLSSTHHPFTAPNPKDLAMLAYAPAKVRGEHYDIVVNGVELGGGSRRIHDAELQKYVLESVLKVDPSRIHQFDHLLKVLGSGCPPHAGIALGFDRLIAILQGADSVRDVIAFPKSAKGADPLVGSPSLVSDKDLETYHLKKSTNGHIGQDEQKLLM
ncbi:tRNA synthetases class II-domain-containing protein [Morchella snyderi]|nr:tRNA synthetases class II-domain-containing protein [Morchella snyderi]